MITVRLETSVIPDPISFPKKRTMNFLFISVSELSPMPRTAKQLAWPLVIMHNRDQNRGGGTSSVLIVHLW